MSFEFITVNPGSGGANIADDTFTAGETTVTIVYSALAFGTPGSGSYQAVDPSHGFPVDVVAALPAGTNVIGHVIVDSIASDLAMNLAEVGGAPIGLGQAPMASSLSVAIASNQTSLPVTVGNAPLAVTGTFWQPTQPVSGTVSITGNLTGSQAVNTAQIAGTVTSVGDGSSDGGTQRVALGSDDNVLTDSRWSSADTNLHTVKASAGRMFRIEVMNTGSGPAYLRLYNKASNPSPGTDTPVRRYTVPGNTAGAGFVMEYLKGRYFSAGIAYDITGGAGDADTTALAANQCVINVDYK